jgi:hypothetical protein
MVHVIFSLNDFNFSFRYIDDDLYVATFQKHLHMDYISLN